MENYKYMTALHDTERVSPPMDRIYSVPEELVPEFELLLKLALGHVSGDELSEKEQKLVAHVKGWIGNVEPVQDLKSGLAPDDEMLTPTPRRRSDVNYHHFNGA